MKKVTPEHAWPLHGVEATRRIEAASAAALPPHALMQRAGLSVARLALALAPHARTVWVACGPGNNGGDGFEAAMHLKHWGKEPIVTWLGSQDKLPPDALASLVRAREAGVSFAAEPPGDFGLAIDALLGIGATRPVEGRMAQWLQRMNAGQAPVLCVDVPSGLDAATGFAPADMAFAGHRTTLALLTLKPGLFTASGRDAAGDIWLDDLGALPPEAGPCAMLGGPAPRSQRPHASHKGTWGDVAVIGGAPGMAGAALLAASAALHAGAGRVYAALLDAHTPAFDPSQPELMIRGIDGLPLTSAAVVCGCGGGDAIRAVLPRVLSSAPRAVFDADALNAIAADTQLQELLRRRAARGWETLLTPHPLEAARLSGGPVAQVQADRLAAATQLAQDYRCTVLLKGSGSIIAAPGRTPVVNPTGNALLGTAGTGDVLAGMAGARLAAGMKSFEAASEAAFVHGQLADSWPSGLPLTASALARHLPR